MTFNETFNEAFGLAWVRVASISMKKVQHKQVVNTGDK